MVIREMNTLKVALGDYIFDNFNKQKQGNFLKENENAVGIALPLKDEQIKVTKRDQVLIKQRKSQTTTGHSTNAAENRYMMLYGKRKKDEYKEYDLKTNKIVEMKKKVRNNYGANSESDN